MWSSSKWLNPVPICRRHACGSKLAVSLVISQTSSRCVADKPQTCRIHFAVSRRRQREGSNFVRYYHPVYSVRSFQMTQRCLRHLPASILIEKIHRRSSKRSRRHRRQTGRVELNLKCRRQVCVKLSHMPESIAGGNGDLAAGTSQARRRHVAGTSQARRRHVCAICELGFN